MISDKDWKHFGLLAMEWAGMEQMSQENAVEAGGLYPARNAVLRAAVSFVNANDRREFWQRKEFRELMSELCELEGHRESRVFAGTVCGRCGNWLERRDV